MTSEMEIDTEIDAVSKKLGVYLKSHIVADGSKSQEHNFD